MPAQPIQNELNDNMPTYYPSNDNFQEESYYPAIDYPAMDIPSEEIPFDGTTGGIQAFVVPT
eukprot:9516312-Ditylum_brightwellii.AAC.1